MKIVRQKKLWNRICDLFSGGEDSNGNQKVHLKDIVCNIVSRTSNAIILNISAETPARNG